MAARILRVALKDYRSIANCNVLLEPLTILVGPNGAGKSNFLDGLRFLVHSMHAPLEQVLDARYGIGSILRKLPGGKRAASFTIEIGFQIADGNPGTYWITLAEESDGGFRVESESCQVGSHSFKFTPNGVTHSESSTPAFTGDRPALVAFGSMPAFAPVFTLISGITMYSPNPEKMRRQAPPGAGRMLSRDASNAADVVSRLERTAPQVLARIREYLHSFNPEFRDLTVTEGGGNRWLSFLPDVNPSNWRLNSSDVSDGTLRATAILLAIFQVETTQTPVTLVGLEEPESNLHPAAAGVLLDALVEASQSVPIIASTHSADLLDRREFPDSSLRIVALEDGQTVIAPIDAASKSIIVDRLYTAGELLRSNQLNPSRGVPSQ
jgi:predicted ATPase